MLSTILILIMPSTAVVFITYFLIIRISEKLARKEAEKKLSRGQAISLLLMQDKNNPVSMEQQVIDMYALNREVLDELAPADILKFKTEFYGKIREWFPNLPLMIREKQILVDESIANLEESLYYYFNPPT